MPAIMFCYCKLRWARLRLLLGFGTLFAVVVLSLSAIDSPQRFLNYSIVAFMPYLWLGVLLADVRLCFGSKLVCRRPAAALVLGLLCAGIFVLSGPLYHWPWLNLLVKLSIIFIIFICVFLTGRVLRDLCRSPLIAAVDRLSYPVYLTHLQTIQIVTGWLFGAMKLTSWKTMFGVFLPIEVSLVVGVAYVFRTMVSPMQSALLASVSAQTATDPGPPPAVGARTGVIEPAFACPGNQSARGADQT
jgi:peptidoglycan/LPS O-acetylase OafA/YrhL